MAIEKNNTIGLTERITLLGNNNKEKALIARIDTGAVISSIDMKLAAELELGPVKKTKRVKNANGVSERPVVSCGFVINDKEYTMDVTLADRKHLKYRVLIGQNILKKTNLYINPRK